MQDSADSNAGVKAAGIVLIALIFLASLALCLFVLTRPAGAQDAAYPDYQHHHPPEHTQLHEKFYQGWMRLDLPGGDKSCCSEKDCYPTVMLQASDGAWYALRYDAAMMLEARGRSSNGGDVLLPPLTDAWSWIRVPEERIEHNAGRVDLGVLSPHIPRDSPDGRSHACVSGDHVLCAIVGFAL